MAGDAWEEWESGYVYRATKPSACEFISRNRPDRRTCMALSSSRLHLAQAGSEWRNGSRSRAVFWSCFTFWI